MRNKNLVPPYVPSWNFGTFPGDKQMKKYREVNVVDELQNVIDVLNLGVVGHAESVDKNYLFTLIDSFVVPYLEKIINSLEDNE